MAQWAEWVTAWRDVLYCAKLSKEEIREILEYPKSSDRFDYYILEEIFEYALERIEHQDLAEMLRLALTTEYDWDIYEKLCEIGSFAPEVYLGNIRRRKLPEKFPYTEYECKVSRMVVMLRAADLYGDTFRKALEMLEHTPGVYYLANYYSSIQSERYKEEKERDIEKMGLRKMERKLNLSDAEVDDIYQVLKKRRGY